MLKFATPEIPIKGSRQQYYQASRGLYTHTEHNRGAARSSVASGHLWTNSDLIEGSSRSASLSVARESPFLYAALAGPQLESSSKIKFSFPASHDVRYSCAVYSSCCEFRDVSPVTPSLVGYSMLPAANWQFEEGRRATPSLPSSPRPLTGRTPTGSGLRRHRSINN